MTRHEAVEEEEKTHTELVSAGRQGGQHEAAFAHGVEGEPAPCLLGALGWSKGATWWVPSRRGGAAHGRASRTDGRTDVRSRRHAGEPEGQRVARTGGHNAPRPLAAPMLMSYPE